jgi:hypothetical protein
MKEINAKNSRRNAYGGATLAINKYGTFMINKQAMNALSLSEGSRVSLRMERKSWHIKNDPDHGFSLKLDSNGMLRFNSMVAAEQVIGKRPTDTHRFLIDPETGQIKKP